MFNIFIYYTSLHVLGIHVPIIRRKLLYLCDTGICHSVCLASGLLVGFQSKSGYNFESTGYDSCVSQAGLLGDNQCPGCFMTVILNIDHPDFLSCRHFSVGQQVSYNSEIAALVFMNTNIGKATPLQAWTGPDGSRKLRLPDFKTIGK